MQSKYAKLNWYALQRQRTAINPRKKSVVLASMARRSSMAMCTFGFALNRYLHFDLLE